MQTYVTTVNANLRSSPNDPGDHSNRLVTLTRGHWVNLIGIAAGSWGEVWTIFRNVEYRGYVSLNLLTKVNASPRAATLPRPSVERHRLFDEREFVELKKFMSILPPSEGAKPAEALSMSRSREVEVDWDYVLSPSLPRDYGDTTAAQPFSRAENITYFMTYFLAIWGLNQVNYADYKDRLFAKLNIEVPVLELITPIPALGESRYKAVFKPHTDAYVLKHPVADRIFWLQSVDETSKPVSDADFADWAAFTKMFASKVKAAMPALAAPAGTVQAGAFVSAVEEVDLAPAVILRQFSELSSIKEFTESLDKQATEFGKQGIAGLMTSSEIDGLISGVLKMKSPEVERRFGLERLADRASDLGYVLNIGDKATEYVYEDGSKLQVEPGKLYQPYQTRIYWVTEHRRVSEWHDDGFFGIGGSSGRVEWIERIRHEREVIKYKQVAVDLDPWTERQDELLKKEGLRSYRFEKMGADYRTSQGETLESIVSQCERDETFRRQTAIWLPVYEQSLTRGEVLTKYIIFKRPYKGIMPVRFPRLYVQESLTYRTKWKSSELGELVYTINLAPGEERTVTIEQKVSKQVEDTRSTTSILDLTETDSLELSTEIEKEAKSSTESSKSSSWSASASGSYGPIGGSVGASGESRTTTSQFARNMERLARKAAHNLTRRTQKEVKSSTSIRADFSRSETTAIKIHNINDGRTLNLLFFRLFNLFTAGVYVDNLRLLSESGVEVIAGSGVTIPRIYELYDISNALQVFDFRSLPFPTVHAPGTEAYAKLFNAYWSYVLDRLIKLLDDDYGVDDTDDDGAKGMLRFSAKMVDITSTARDFSGRLRLEFGEGPDAYSLENIYKALRREIQRIEAALAETVESSETASKPLKEHELRVASPGLFVDTFMGVRPATEPYAEEMRAQQVRLKSAEAAREQSLANYYNRLAGHDEADGVGFPAIVGRAISDKSIEITFRGEATEGAWLLKVDGLLVRSVAVVHGQSTAEFSWQEEQGWIGEPEAHALELVSPTGEAFPFVLFPAIRV